MPYTDEAKIAALLPANYLADAADDDRDGDADEGTLAAVIAAVDTRIDGLLGGRYSVPFTSPVPAVVAEASLVFALAALYRRRGVADEANPWAEREAQAEKRLERIGRGEEMLTFEAKPARPAGTLISAPSLLHSEHQGVLS
jgi:phage gp36-like protein